MSNGLRPGEDQPTVDDETLRELVDGGETLTAPIRWMARELLERRSEAAQCSVCLEPGRGREPVCPGCMQIAGDALKTAPRSADAQPDLKRAFAAGFKAHMFRKEDDYAGIDGAYDRWRNRERAPANEPETDPRYACVGCGKRWTEDNDVTEQPDSKFRCGPCHHAALMKGIDDHEERRTRGLRRVSDGDAVAPRMEPAHGGDAPAVERSGVRDDDGVVGVRGEPGLNMGKDQAETFDEGDMIGARMKALDDVCWFLNDAGYQGAAAAIYASPARQEITLGKWDRTEGDQDNGSEEKEDAAKEASTAEDDRGERDLRGAGRDAAGRTEGRDPADRAVGVRAGHRVLGSVPNAGVVHASWPNCGVPGPFSERRGEVTCRNCPLPAPTRVATPPSVPAGWVEDFSYRHALSENATLELHDLVDEATDTPSAAHVYECDLVDCARPATVEADDGRSLCDVHGRAAPSSCVAHDPGHPHLIDGEFQSDKYPTCPRGKVPLSTGDLTAQDLLWAYAQRRRVVDAEFADDLEKALRAKGYEPPTESRSVARLAQACELLARAHAILENDPMLEKLPGQIADFLWGSDEAGKAGGVK